MAKSGEFPTEQASDRIHRICSLLEAVWMKYPDLRFYQLIEDTAPDTNMDLFYVNDDATERNLQNVLERGL